MKVNDRVIVNDTCELTGDPDEDLIGREGEIIDIEGDNVTVLLDGDDEASQFDVSEIDPN